MLNMKENSPSKMLPYINEILPCTLYNSKPPPKKHPRTRAEKKKQKEEVNAGEDLDPTLKGTGSVQPPRRFTLRSLSVKLNLLFGRLHT